MVEFGLKLEDNKVSEWSDHYIQYENLKKILKKCSQAVERYNQLHAKDPVLAAQVEEDYRKGLPTPTGSSLNLAGSEHSSLRSGLSSPARETDKLSSPAGGTATDAASDYGSVAPSSISDNAISRLIKASSGVTDYFSKSYERQLHEAIKTMDQRQLEFEKALLEDIDRVNDFYNTTLKEMEDRLVFLKESVATSFGPPQPPSEEPRHQHQDSFNSSSDEYLTTPLIQNRRKQGALALAMRKFTQSIQQKSRKSSSIANVPLLPDFDDEEDRTTEEEKEEVIRRTREAESIQRALVDLYRRAKLLNNFAIMNYTGFVKIVKKHDKTLREHKGRYKNAIRPEKICNEGKDVEELANHMERLYANWFCDANVSEARAQMLPKRGDGLEMDWSQLRLGYRMGMSAILAVWVTWDCVWGMLSEGRSTIGGRTAFPVFRACGGLLLLQWLWGISVWVWSRYRVNYIFLFDFNPSIVNSPIVLFNEAVDNSLFFLFAMLLYYKAGAHAIPGSFPAGVFPCFLVLYTIYQLIFPLRTRKPMWESIWLVITAPMASPTFFHGYVGDIFTSMVKVFQDMAWALGFVLTGDWLISEDLPASTKHRWAKSVWYSKVLIPILTLLPLWFRFNQCLRRYADTRNRFPHLANAFKYALSMTVTLFGAFHPLYLSRSAESNSLFQQFWTIIFVTSSLYSFFWDVYMDWGLGRPKFNFLGPRLMYPHRTYYYVVIMIDLVLRFAWVLTLVPPNSGAKFALPAYLTAVSMMLELFRRTLWGFFRLENEHRSNTAGFRRVGFVPLHFTTGHQHTYKREEEHRGFSVLIEVAFITALVIGAAVASVVAAQHETERMRPSSDGEL